MVTEKGRLIAHPSGDGNILVYSSEQGCSDMAADPGDIDVIIVGSGAAGLTAATVCAKQGLNVTLLEKSSLFGGSTAISGGTVWIPNNPAAAELGLRDSREAAMRYLEGSIGARMRKDLVEAYVDNAAPMLEFMHSHTAVRLASRAVAPDYYPDTAGWVPGGRAADPAPFDGRRLGKLFGLLRPPLHSFVALGGMMVNRNDINHLLGMTSSLTSLRESGRLIGRYALDRLSYPRGTRLVLGNALAGSLLLSASEAGVRLWRGARALELLRDGKRINGLRVERDGCQTVLRSRFGVVLASGGFGANETLRKQHVSTARHISMAPATNVGEGHAMATAIGAALDDINVVNAFLTPVSRMVNQDGSNIDYPHLIMDRAKPGLIAVNRAGRRFVNEALSYHDFGRAMLSGDGAGPIEVTHLIVDSRFIRRYGLGLVRPGPGSYRQFIRTGYLKKAGSLSDLAAQLKIPARALELEVARHNQFADSGLDEDFGKGGSAYQRYLGDPAHKPNPCLGTIAKPPFYCVTVHPGDIGTSKGLRINAQAQVLDAAGRIIEGLYACGNDTNSVMAGSYPGAGITLGPAMTFGYIAAQDIVSRKTKEHAPHGLHDLHLG